VPNLSDNSLFPNILCSNPSLDNVFEKLSKIFLSSIFEEAKYFPLSFQSQSTWCSLINFFTTSIPNE